MIGLLGEVAPAPLVPAGVLAALGLVAFLGFLVATGMLKAYAHSIGYLIRWLAQNIDVGIPTGIFGRLHPFRAISHGLDALDGTIRNQLAELALGYEETATWAFAQAAAILKWTADEIAALAHDVARSFTHVTDVAIPGALSDAEKLTRQRLVDLANGIDRLRVRADAELHRLSIGIDRVGYSLGHTIALDTARTRARVIGLEHELGVTRRKVRRLERLLGALAFAGAVGIALKRLGLNWIRCRNLRTVGKRVCGMDPDLLADLLLGTVAVLGVVSVVEYAKELEAASDELIGLLALGIREMRLGDPLALDGPTFPH